MKDFTRFILLLIIITIAPFTLNAQKDSARKNEFTASLNYQSKLHYFGRTDSLQSSGIFPSVGYELKCGFYAQGSFIFVHNNSLPYNYTGSTIEAGYRLPQAKKINGNIFISKFLYKQNSTLVQSTLKYQTGINLSFNNKIININSGFDIKYSNTTDIGATAGLDHIFISKIANKPMAFAFDPSANINFGTQKFSEVYINKQKILGIPMNNKTTVNKSAFNILSYEISAPIVFVAGKFNTSLIPAYVIPQNLLAGERGTDMFYLTASFGIRL
jgi:hypothetical protein